MYKLSSNQPLPDSPLPKEILPPSGPTRDCSELSTTLPVSADWAYALFSDFERAPEWMSIIRMAHAFKKDPEGRVLSAAFIANLDHASLGYTLHYSYQDEAKTVSWSTSPNLSTQLSGTCSFRELGPNACLMHYEICRESESELPQWGDEMYQGHPASATLCEFRDFVNRTKHDLMK